MGPLSSDVSIVVGFVAGQGVLCLVDEVRHVGDVPWDSRYKYLYLERIFKSGLR